MAQQMIAVSDEFKGFIDSLTKKHVGAGKSKDAVNLTQKEACDALMAFHAAHGTGVETNEEGEKIPTDLLLPFIQEQFEARQGKTRTLTAVKKVNELACQMVKILRGRGLSDDEITESLKATGVEFPESMRETAETPETVEA